jgi:hypothetical protein
LAPTEAVGLWLIARGDDRGPSSGCKPGGDIVSHSTSQEQAAVLEAEHGMDLEFLGSFQKTPVAVASELHRVSDYTH